MLKITKRFGWTIAYEKGCFIALKMDPKLDPKKNPATVPVEAAEMILEGTGRHVHKNPIRKPE